MIPPKEIIYRKKIAENLNLIEPGLTLVEEEHKLDNSNGTRGYIDILCRDRFNHIVIIEIKRSKAASRQALHELNKYVALIKANNGLDQDEIRCMLISTVWTELIVPFSEFYHQTSYQLMGYKLESDEKANNIFFTKIEPLPKDKHKYELYYKHYIYLYEENIDRNNAAKNILLTANKSIVEGGVVISIDYMGKNPIIIYKNAHYVAYTKVSDVLRQKWISENIEYYEDNLKHDIETDIDEEISCNIGHSLHDSMDIGYPEKLTNMLIDGWKVRAIDRFGTLKNTKKIITDQQIIADACGIYGTHTSLYMKLHNPLHKKSWEKAKKKIQYSLLGNHIWKNLVNSLLTHVEQEHPDSDVAFYIFNPLNILYSMYEYTNKNSSSYFPQIDITVSSNSKKELIVLRSILVLDKSKKDIDINKAVSSIYGSVYGFFDTVHFHEVWRNDDKLVELLNYRYLNFLYLIKQNEVEKLVVGDNVSDVIDEDPHNYIAIDKSIDNNSKLQDDIKSFFASGYQG